MNLIYRSSCGNYETWAFTSLVNYFRAILYHLAYGGISYYRNRHKQIVWNFSQPAKNSTIDYQDQWLFSPTHQTKLGVDQLEIEFSRYIAQNTMFRSKKREEIEERICLNSSPIVGFIVLPLYWKMNENRPWPRPIGGKRKIIRFFQPGILAQQRWRDMVFIYSMIIFFTET